jgi:hypothetical protein
MDIEEVLASDYIIKLKTGAWKKQLNKMSDSTYLVEVYWSPWISEAGREQQWEKTFTDEREAYRFYENLKSAAQVKKTMEVTKFSPDVAPQTYVKIWNVIDQEKLRKYCEERWEVPVSIEASDYLGRLLARRIDQFKIYLPLPIIDSRALTARDMYRAASEFFD